MIQPISLHLTPSSTTDLIDAVPDAVDMEIAELSSLSHEARADISRWEKILQPLREQRCLRKAFQNLCRHSGIAEGTIRKKFYAWREADFHWTGLIDNRRRGNSRQLPKNFVVFWKQIQLSCQRDTSGKTAYLELLRRWRNGNPIPGYTTRPLAEAGTDVPAGWSYANLMRKPNKPTDYEKAAFRIGRGNAASQLPDILTTRVPYKPGQILMPDDQEYDVNTVFPMRARKYFRGVGFNMLCYASACEILQGYKPVLKNQDGMKEKLRQVDYHWFLVNWATTIGYRNDTGTVITEEGGTTRSSELFKERMSKATGGKVTFLPGGMFGNPAFTGLFQGTPRGNPRHKASRESWFNLLRNRSSMMLGQTGLNPQHAPEENYGMEQYIMRLMDAILVYPELAEVLKYPVLTWDQFIFATETLVREVNSRTDHNLQGWEEMGHVTHEWRLTDSQPWMPKADYLALSEGERIVADSLIAKNPNLWQPRYLSPLEVWEGSRHQLRKVSGSAIPVLLGPEAAIKAKVDISHQITIEDYEVDPEPMVFISQLDNGMIVPQHAELLVYLNPYNTQKIEVCDMKGRFLGTAPRSQRHGKLDVESLRHEYRKVQKMETELLRPVVAAGRKKLKDRTEMHRHNAAAIAEVTGSGRAISQGQKDRARKLQKNFDGAGELLVEAPAVEQEKPKSNLGGFSSSKLLD